MQVVVEVDVSGAEVSSEQSSVGGEDCGYIDAPALAKGKGDTCQPFVELYNNGSFRFVGDILTRGISISCVLTEEVFAAGFLAYLTQEPCDNVSENDSLVGLVISRGRWNAGCGPQVALPLIQVTISGFSVEQKDSRCTVDKPSSIQSLNTASIHGFHSLHKGGIFGHDFFNLDRGLLRMSDEYNAVR